MLSIYNKWNWNRK